MAQEYGVVGLVRAVFQFESGYFVQFETDKTNSKIPYIIKVQEPDKKVSVYKGNLFPDAMNANRILRDHINDPQLLFKEN